MAGRLVTLKISSNTTNQILHSFKLSKLPSQRVDVLVVLTVAKYEYQSGQKTHEYLLWILSALTEINTRVMESQRIH